MKTITIDVVGPGARSDGMSRTVSGEIRIDTGDQALDRAIAVLYRIADQKAMAFMEAVVRPKP